MSHARRQGEETQGPAVTEVQSLYWLCWNINPLDLRSLALVHKSLGLALGNVNLCEGHREFLKSQDQGLILLLLASVEGKRILYLLDALRLMSELGCQVSLTVTDGTFSSGKRFFFLLTVILLTVALSIFC